MNNKPMIAGTPLQFDKMIMRSNAAHQSGAVLIVSLIMLLLLTIIGITGSQVTGLEEKMAGNSRNYNLAFQAAESALRVGEAATKGSPVFYTGAQPINWADAAVTTYTSGVLTGVYQNPVYIIEALPKTAGTATGAEGSLEAGTPPPATGTSWYRITARGTGGTANALVTLQSIYRR
jgi:type IV pilus assembly protein PilX